MAIAKFKNNNFFKKASSPILLDYRNSNGDYGFFEEIVPVYFPNKGIKIISTQENINYSFQEVDYYLLDNNKVGKFKRNMSITNTSRELIDIYSITEFRRKYKKKRQAELLNKTITMLIEKKTG